MKRKENRGIFLLLAIFPLFIFTNTVTADADAVPVLESPNVSIIDDTGMIISGQTGVNVKNAIPINYVGTDLKNDLTVSVNGADPSSPTNTSAYAVGQVFKMANAGYYNGEPFTLAFKSTNKKIKVYTVTGSSNYVYPYPTGNTAGAKNTDPEYEVWVEDSEGNEIKDENVRFIFPFSERYAGGSGYSFYELISGNDLLAHLFVQKPVNELDLKYLDVDIAENYTRLVAKGTTTGQLNYLFSPSTHLKLNTGIYTGTYPDGVKTTANTTNNTVQFLNSDALILVPLDNAAPVVVNTVNDSSFKANISVKQTLYAQSSDSFYPTALDITVTVPEVLNTVGNIGNIQVTDKNGEVITNQVTITSTTDGTMKISIPKETLKSLGSNSITIQGLLDINTQDDQIMDYYNKDTKYFTFPVTAKNTDSDKVNSGEAKVKMPGPTGKPIATTVGIGTSTTDLLARDLVGNLSSVLANDVVSVIGFKEEKTFTELGDTSVIVQIKSAETGIISDITVPVKVQTGTVIIDQAKLSWSNTSVSKEKTDVVEKSEETTSIAEELYWQTTFENKQYQLVVKKGTEIITQRLASSISKGDDSWLKETVDIPIDKLSEGDNALTVGIYALKNDGSLKGGALDQIDLTVTVNQNDAELSWSNTSSVTTKTEELDKSTMEETLKAPLYWKTTAENRKYLLITKDSNGKTVESQTILNNSTINEFQEVSIKLPTAKMNYGSNDYTVGVYIQDSEGGGATGTALDEIKLSITLVGTLQILSVPETIDFKLQTVDPNKTIRVDDPEVSGDLIIADTRNDASNKWVVKVALTKPLKSTNDSGKEVILADALRYKASGKEEFLVTSEAEEIRSETNGYGTFDISSEWGTTKESTGFKLETLPANIGQLGEYTGEITYKISDTFEP